MDAVDAWHTHQWSLRPLAADEAVDLAREVSATTGLPAHVESDAVMVETGDGSTLAISSTREWQWLRAFLSPS